MTLGPELGTTHELERVALSFMLNALAHDLNNHLTSLVLGADQLRQQVPSSELAVILRQVDGIRGITERLHEWGQGLFGEGVGDLDLASLCREASDQIDGTLAPPSIEGIAVCCRPDNLLFALRAMARWGELTTQGLPLTWELGLDRVPRSAWAPTEQQVDMASVRMHWGGGGEIAAPELRACLDGFFEVARTPAEVLLMAAWEIVRKIYGRPGARLELLVCEDRVGHSLICRLPLSGEGQESQ